MLLFAGMGNLSVSDYMASRDQGGATSSDYNPAGDGGAPAGASGYHPPGNPGYQDPHAGNSGYQHPSAGSSGYQQPQPQQAPYVPPQSKIYTQCNFDIVWIWICRSFVKRSVYSVLCRKTLTCRRLVSQTGFTFL